MSLQFILGSSGSGKSYHLYQEIIRCSKVHPENNYLIVVPEQFTMQTQRDLVMMHPDKGIMNIDVLSFLRLAYRVFDELGGKDYLVLEDTGKNMVLRKIISKNQEHLSVFKSNANKQGFISELKSFLSEMLQYSISLEDLENLVSLSSSKPLLNGKLKDMLTVYEGFKGFIEDKYITAEEILDALLEMIEESQMIKSSVVCFDGFTGFTPSQYKLIQKLLRICKKVMVTVTIDARENYKFVDEEFKLFHLSKKTISRLTNIAKEVDVTVDNPIILGGDGGLLYRFKDSVPLAFLEHNLFRFNTKKYEEEQRDISIHISQNPREEVMFALRECLHLVREDGLRYRDIAIVTGDVTTYGRYIKEEFTKVLIPHFLDNKKDILSNPLVEIIRSALEIFTMNFSYESVFRFLRSGLLPLEREEIDSLENYVLALGIRGYSGWSKEWTKMYKTNQTIDLVLLNEIRNEIMEYLIPLRDVLLHKESTTIEKTKAFIAFLDSLEVYEQMCKMSDFFQEQKEFILEKEYRQVYKMVLDLFDKLVELLGDEVIAIEEYKDIIEAGLEEEKVGFIPPTMDQILVGDIERTRLKDIKVLFFLGVNDGIIPKVSDGGGILSDMDREFLVQSQVELAPTKRQSAYTEQFYLYLNLTKPQNRLYVSYSKSGNDGKTVRPSYLIGKIRKLFPNIHVIEENQESKDVEHILGREKGMEYLLKGLRAFPYEEMEDEWKELFSWYFKKEDFKQELEKLIEAAFYSNAEEGLSRAVANVLYGKELSNSVTRLEQYAACAFSHFITYGLCLNERQEFKLGAVDLGNIFHQAIELFSYKLEKSPYNWHSITDEESEVLVSQAVEEAVSEYGNSVFFSSKRNEYMTIRILRMMKRTIWAIRKQLKASKFEPDQYELSFSAMDGFDSLNIPLSHEESIHLRGRIDRMDTCEMDDKVYVKVIDYKTGSTDFDIVAMYYGLQLQLVVYLNAAVEYQQKKHPDKHIEPAGIFYYHIDDPLVEKVDKDILIEKAILNELKVSGLVNQSVEVIQFLDSEFGEDGKELKSLVKSDVIPIATGKTGEISKLSSAVSKTRLESMGEFVQNKIETIGSEILSGNTEINPYQLGTRTACDYCNYKGICGFDTKIPGHSYRKLKKVSREDVWKSIEEEVEHE